MSKYLLLVLAVLATLSLVPLLHKGSETPSLNLRLGFDQETVKAFKAWEQKFHINAQNEDVDQRAYRLEVFAENQKKIREHNQQNEGWWMAENKFMDMTSEEFAEKNFGLNLPDNYAAPNEYTPVTSNDQSVNWRDKGVVSAVKDQGKCGGCWSFSTTGNIESAHYIKTGEKVLYSEQQLIDCSRSYGNKGCRGGLMDFAFQYILDNGIETEGDYPYEARDNKCRVDPNKLLHPISSYKDIPTGNCQALSNALQNNPISIGVDAHTWQFYGGGVMSRCRQNLGHAVLLVGYESDQYWLVKNSWGTGWGESGYIRLSPGNTCGLCNAASTSVAK